MSRFVIYDWWISIRFYFKVRCLCMRVLFRAIIGLFAAVFLIFSFFLFLYITCNNKAKSAYFRRQKSIAISFAILNSQELSSVLFFRQKALWFENPKSLQCLENAQRDTTNIAVNKETLCYCLGNIYVAINLVVKYSGTIRTCTKFSQTTYCTRKCGQTTTCIQCLWKTIAALFHLRMLCHENFISVMSVVLHNQLYISN